MSWMRCEAVSRAGHSDRTDTGSVPSSQTVWWGVHQTVPTRDLLTGIVVAL